MRTSCLPTRSSDLSSRIRSKVVHWVRRTESASLVVVEMYLVCITMPFAHALCALYVTLVLLGNCNHVTSPQVADHAAR